MNESNELVNKCHTAYLVATKPRKQNLARVIIPFCGTPMEN